MKACPESLNFAAHVIAINACRTDKTAYDDGVRQLSYGQLAQRIRQFSSVLNTLGIHREERVLLFMHDTVDWPVTFLGALSAGAVPVAVNTLLTAEDYAYIIEDSRCQLAVISAPLLGVLREAMAMAKHEIKWILISEPDHALDGELLDFEKQIEQAPESPAIDTKADEIAFWLYSSGSTGRPKGVVHTHGNLWHTAELYGKPILGVREDDTVFSAAKLFFAYGLGNGLTFPLSVGATTILMRDRPTPDSVFERLKKYQPTIYCGIPTLYASMLASRHLPSRDDVALRICASAGEALPKDLGDRFTRHFGCPILDGIGSTEMLHIFLSNQVDDLRYGTTGKPVPGYEVELRDDAGKPVPQNVIGDLYIKGPSAALMYWNNRHKTTDVFQGQWLKSGDKYTRDADGYYIYAGRSDDMIKVSGQYVSPVEVESILTQHPSVLEAAVIGAPDEEGLIKTIAYVVPQPGTIPDEQMASELKTFVKSRLAPFKYPRTIHFVDELPKTATGKIQRFRLRQYCEAA
uniref:benzoate-CoA ligase family protein n=1 Tax=Castellaniella defragrans TaxID=75697 RepID=UPI0033405E16